jgi:DNA-binding CsgD family transcriptional regulator
MGRRTVPREIRGLERLCAEPLGHGELQARAGELLGAAVPFDVAIMGTVDPASMLETSCVPIGMPYDAEREAHFLHLEYTSGDPLSYVEVANRPERAAALGAEVDDLGGVRRYAELLAPLGVGDELRAMFVADGHCWGSATLYRGTDSPPFSVDEVALLAGVSDILARALRRAFLRVAATTEGLDDPPGHCTIDKNGHLLTTSVTAERWLDTLGPADQMPPVVASLLARLEHEPEARATAVGSAGPLTLHATAAKGAYDDAVAVIIERPRPIHLTPLIVAAHGLTPRETDVAEVALRGLTTRQIARHLGITDYTVQDHLKSVFAKVGVSTRGELSWELYARHYLPPAQVGAPPGPYGYFLGG